MKFYKFLLFFSVVFFKIYWAQQYNLTNKFNTENSKISGNFIFNLVEDKSGYVWIATQNGVSRFDGKNFFNYTTRDGLPSNDVLQLIIDGHGVLWVNCFRQPPAYFNVKKNQFVTVTNAKIDKLSSNLNSYFVNERGNIVVSFSTEYIIEIDKKSKVKFFIYNTVTSNNNVFNIAYKPKTTNLESYLKLINKNLIEFQVNNVIQTNYNKSSIIFIYKNKIEFFSNFKINPFSYKKTVFKYNTPIKWKKITFNKIYVITTDNYFYEYDFDSLKLINKFIVPEDINSGFVDSNGNFFGGTQNDGLKFFTLEKLKKIELPISFKNDNFISLTINKNNEIFAGNLSGDVLKFKNEKIEFIKLDETSWIRKNLFLGKNILTISDNCYWINFKNKSTIYADSKSIVAIKKAVKVNDSIALLSTIKGIYELNIEKNKTKKINFPDERVGEIIKINNQTYYIISASGLYEYNYLNQNYKHIFEKFNFNEAVYDGNLLFVNTYKNEIYVFKNGKLLQIITYPMLPENMGKLKIINHKLWLASKSGFYTIDYKIINNKINFTLENSTKSDGLNSNDVLDFTNDSNFVYVATGRGISIVPINFVAKKYNIKTEIVSIKINEKQQIIKKYYNLKADQNFITLTLSGIEISGHFNHFLYKINDDKWNKLNENILSLNLKGGENKLQIVAVDNNGNIGKTPIKIVFDVSIPFYENIWFWTLISGLFFGGIFAFYGRWKFLLQKNYYKQKLALENQRSKITADLHDDIGATLSSLQINSAIANKMIEKEKIIDAQKILKKIETQSQKLSENIGDIVWSLKPKKDALMTLNTRIINSANEILGSSEIYFQIKIDEEINEEFHDFSERKNIVLIVKEAMNNIAKYSKATEVFIIFKKIENKFVFEIKDNGIGFTPDFSKGNGLQNMKRRAEEIGGSFELFSENGTTIKICIPEIRD